ALRDVVAELRRDGYSAIGCEADVSAPSGNQRVVELALREFGSIDIFHANAAVMQFTHLHAMGADEGARMIDVNLKGTIYGCSAVLPAMVQQRSGCILITASVLASVGDPGLPIYGATKGGLRALCRSIAVAYGPQGIRCNCICPGDVR